MDRSKPDLNGLARNRLYKNLSSRRSTMPAPIMAPTAALAEPVVWNEDPQRQRWWTRILAAGSPENSSNDEFQP